MSQNITLLKKQPYAPVQGNTQPNQYIRKETYKSCVSERDLQIRQATDQSLSRDLEKENITLLKKQCYAPVQGNTQQHDTQHHYTSATVHTTT